MKRDRLAVATFVLIAVALAYLLFQLLRFAFYPQPEKPSKPISTVGLIPSVEYYNTTTTEAPTTTTTEVLRTTTTRANRGTRRTTATQEVTDEGATPRAEAQGVDFWRRLANCESADGSSGAFIGFFQFSYDTARKVGIDGSESYEVQRDAAIRWAQRIHPAEGSTSGWPNCWWVALRS